MDINEPQCPSNSAAAYASGSIFTVTGTINNFKCVFYPAPWKQLKILIFWGRCHCLDTPTDTLKII